MLLKVSLVVAILASIATLVISHLQVDTGIKNLKGTLADTKTQLTKAEEDAATSKKNAKAAKEEAEKTTKELDETKGNLEIAMGKWKEQQSRADESEAKEKKASGQLNEAQRDLSAWGALGLPVEQVRGRLAELAKVRDENEALGEEKKVMLRNINTLQARVAIYELDKQVAPPLPEGLRGKVIAVEPKWDFVVLDIGGDQGVVERGEMLVNREGKLVAKVRITSVEPKRSIANILPEWKQADVVEGDSVMH